ncbi:MAG TPA: VWA domain-containing protein [Bryobacteraceae bacterium]|nr:VWA domain-containing protein [Bryobacteraceae bacterium]
MKCVLLATCLAAVSFAATSDQFRVNANVVLINATVLDHHDRLVRGLTRDQFRLYEDRAEQRIAYFSEEDTPVSLAVVFDTSGSMLGKLDGMRTALDAILKDANPGDEFALVTFANEPRVAASWSPDAGEIQSRVLLASAHGQTALLDALETALGQLKHARNPRKAILIVSDGGDNYSRATERDVMRSLAETGVQIYAIDNAEPEYMRERSPEEFEGPDLLARICDGAGGRYFQVDGQRELSAAAQQISRELRSQYVIGYVPSRAERDGRFRHVRVQLNHTAGAPKLSVFWRRGYRAPSY